MCPTAPGGTHEFDRLDHRRGLPHRLLAARPRPGAERLAIDGGVLRLRPVAPVVASRDVHGCHHVQHRQIGRASCRESGQIWNGARSENHNEVTACNISLYAGFIEATTETV